MEVQEKKKWKKNLGVRILMVLILLTPLLFPHEFYVHAKMHFTGSLYPMVIRHQWTLVLLNILVFLSFLVPLSFRRKMNWKEYGLITAFFVSLFVEMYGLPLTIFFASNYIAGPGTGEALPIAFSFRFIGTDIAMTHAMIYATALMTVGMALIVVGWVTLYKRIDNEKLVTSGIYSISRHPQYLGFILIIIGWLVGWPTILTVVFSPILVIVYVRVARKEEKEMSDVEGYREYRKRVPFLV